MKRTPIDYGKPIPVRLPKDVLARIEAIALRLSEPRSTIMRIAMRLGLDSLEKAVETETPELSSLLYPSKADAGLELNETKPPRRRKTG